MEMIAQSSFNFWFGYNIWCWCFNNRLITELVIALSGKLFQPTQNNSIWGCNSWLHYPWCTAHYSPITICDIVTLMAGVVSNSAPPHCCQLRTINSIHFQIMFSHKFSILDHWNMKHKIWRTLKQYPSVLCGSNDNLNSISIIYVSVFSNHLLRHRKVAKVSHIPSIIWTHKNPCFNSTKLFVFWSH